MRLVPMSAVKPASVKTAPTLEQVLKRPTPAHIAIIMDGNGRWAERRGLPRLMGHRAGRRAVREVVGVMRIREQVLREESPELKRNNVQLRTIGRVDLLPEKSRRILEDTRAYLAGNDGLILVLALSYGGRAEIVDAVRRILAEARENGA